MTTTPPADLGRQAAMPLCSRTLAAALAKGSLQLRSCLAARTDLAAGMAREHVGMWARSLHAPLPPSPLKRSAPKTSLGDKIDSGKEKSQPP